MNERNHKIMSRHSKLTLGDAFRDEWMDVRDKVKRNWLSADTTGLRKMATLTWVSVATFMSHAGILLNTMTTTPYPWSGFS